MPFPWRGNGGTISTNLDGIWGISVYDIKVLEGELPPAGGPVALFIDPIGHPLSATSVAGVHRRTPASRAARRSPMRRGGHLLTVPGRAAGTWVLRDIAGSN